MTFSHLKSVCTLCPTGWQNFLFPGAHGPQQRSTEREVVRVRVTHVVRTVVSAVVRAIRRVAVVVVEHPRGRQGTDKYRTQLDFRQCTAVAFFGAGKGAVSGAAGGRDTDAAIGRQRIRAV